MANYCTPEIDTSEIIVDVQWRFPMDPQWHFPTYFHSSVFFFKRIVTCPADFYWKFPLDFQRHIPNNRITCIFPRSGVLSFCPENGSRAAPRLPSDRRRPHGRLAEWVPSPSQGTIIMMFCFIELTRLLLLLLVYYGMSCCGIV